MGDVNSKGPGDNISGGDIADSNNDDSNISNNNNNNNNNDNDNNNNNNNNNNNKEGGGTMYRCIPKMVNKRGILRRVRADDKVESGVRIRIRVRVMYPLW